MTNPLGTVTYGGEVQLMAPSATRIYHVGHALHQEHHTTPREYWKVEERRYAIPGGQLYGVIARWSDRAGWLELGRVEAPAVGTAEQQNNVWQLDAVAKWADLMGEKHREVVYAGKAP